MIITAVNVERDAVVHELHPQGKEAWERLETMSDGLWQTCLYQSRENADARARLALAKTPSMGLSAAAALTATGIQLFRPSHVVMLGITAGLREETGIGDIIVATELYDYGAGKWEENESQLTFKLRTKQEKIEEEVRQWADEIGRDDEFLKGMRNRWFLRGSDDGPPGYLFRAPKVRLDIMVSGAAVVNAGAIWDRVLGKNDKVRAIDMEAYAVAHATKCASGTRYNPFCLIAKSVCDYGVAKGDDAQEYAAYTSVNFFREYLERYILGYQAKNAPARQNVPAPD